MQCVIKIIGPFGERTLDADCFFDPFGERTLQFSRWDIRRMDTEKEERWTNISC